MDRTAVVVGTTSEIGGTLSEQLGQVGDFDQAMRLNRPSINLCGEASIAWAAAIESD
jgi:hypothetical protein